MGSRWTTTSLGDEVDFLTGFPFKSAEYTDHRDGIKLVRGDNVVQGHLRWDGVKRWPVESLDGLGDYELEAGDVVLAMDRPWIEAGLKYSEITSHDLPALLVQRVSRLRGKERLHTRFLKYLIGSPYFTGHVLAVQTGTAVPHISGRQIKEFEFDIPPLPEQKAIAHILGTLDDKIELNRRMNATLEGMAQALFKSWFVDFAPVIDNALAAGNPIPDELATRAEVRRQALANGTANREAAQPFPAAFQLTEAMGWIPEGWEVKSVGEVAEKIGMGPFGSRITRDNFKDEGVPIIRGGNLTAGFVDKDFVYLTEDKATELKSSNVFPDDIIFTHRGTIGQVGIIPKKAQYPRYVASQSQMFLRINQEITSSAYAFNYFKSGSGMQRLLGYASQVGVPAIARPTTSLKSLPILIPAIDTVEAFGLQNTSYVNKINACDEQTEGLTKLRDTLLPKLISGELRIPEAEQLIDRISS